MSDKDNSNEGKKPKVIKRDLPDNKSSSVKDIAKISAEAKNALKSPLLKSVIGEANIGLPKLSGLNEATKAARGLSAKIDEITSPYKNLSEQLKAFSLPTEGLSERINKIGLNTHFPEFKNVANLLSTNQQALDSIQKFDLKPSYPTLPEIEHSSLTFPVNETNETLGRIEIKFEELYNLGADVLKVTQGVNVSAMEFLDGFDKAARKQTIVGYIAIGIAVAAIFTPIVYDLLYADPRAENQLQSMVDLQSQQILQLQNDNKALLNGFSELIRNENDDTTQILKNILNVLEDQNSIKQEQVSNHGN